MKILFVSHCDFSGNSAIQLHAIATELARRGHEPMIAVPGNPRSVRDLGRAAYAVTTHRAVRRAPPQGVELVHAVTPREAVRATADTVARSLGCRYVVHLEDDERALADLEGAFAPARRLADPSRSTGFLERAAGVTAVVDPLLDLAPDGRPRAVVRPGFDEAVLVPARSADRVRAILGLRRHELVLVYTGNVVRANVDAYARLLEATRLLRDRGMPVRLVRTGWRSIALPRARRDGVLDLGWVARRRIPELLAAADVLVQPGARGDWDEHRFPSKVPEFLASGRPVVLPRVNIGHELEHGREALLLGRGDAGEIAESVATLAADPQLRAAIGEAGRAFALRELTWTRSVDALEAFYGDVGGSPS